MHILIYFPVRLPVTQYGSIERVIWGLGKALVRMGHRVTYLAGAGSTCDFAACLAYDPTRPLSEQIPADADLVHLHALPQGEELTRPYLYTEHTNGSSGRPLPLNTVFLSRNHAERHGAETFVYNGLEWSDYGVPNWDTPRRYFHFLGNAAWRVKNVRGAIEVVRGMHGERLMVLGGTRLNIKMGFRLTLSPKIHFAGMVGGEEKLRLLNGSKGLIFPVRWHEPFGLAVIESLYFGAPVFATPYGSLSELVTSEVGFCSPYCSALREAARHAEAFSRQRCHDYARELFSADRMAQEYLHCYERVLNGESFQKTHPVLRRAEGEERFLPWYA